MAYRQLIFFVSIVVLGTACRKNRIPREEGSLRFTESIQVDGLSRTAIIQLPANYYDGSNFPVIIAMHGGGGTGEQFERSTGLTEKAATKGYIVVYPDGVKSNKGLKVQTWNAGGCCDYAMDQNIDDVKFISHLIDRIAGKFSINTQRVYATGHSNGGMMAYRLACELPSKIAAIAPNGSTMMIQPCNPGRPVPILHMHSKLDERVPYLGGVGTGFTNSNFPSISSVLAVWSVNNGCNPTPAITEKAGYTLKEWKDCNNAAIHYYLTNDGGHSWPGGKPGWSGGDNPSQAIDANDLMLAFFSQY